MYLISKQSKNVNMELNYLLRVLYDMPQDEVVTVKGLIQILEDALDIEEEDRLRDEEIERALDERIVQTGLDLS